MKEVRARLHLFALLTMVLSLIVMVVAAIQATALDVSGKWVSATSGEGLIQTDAASKRYFDWEWTLSQSGSSVVASGSYTLTRNIPYMEYDPWSSYIGITYPYYNPDGMIVGDQLVFDMTDPSQYDYGQIVLSVSGNRMFGSGSYVDAGGTVHYEFDLKKAGLFGLAGLGGLTMIASAAAIVVAIAAIVVVSAPLKLPFQPGVTKVPSQGPTYVKGEERTTDELAVPFTYPTGEAQPQTGVGVTVGSPSPPTGKPLPPKEHFRHSPDHPRCPFHHDVALVPHYKGPESDPGSWYCSRCKGYPWGRS